MYNRMMPYWIPLLLSALSINGVHGYLLRPQRSKRRPTISEHAVLHKKSFALYVLGHILGGGFFLIFANQYYMDTVNLPWLFWLSVLTVVFEYIQAFLPAHGRTNEPHIIAALIMWMTFISVGLLSIIFVPAATPRKILASLVYAALLISLVYAFNNLQRVYKYQMTMVLLFYTSLFIIVL